MSSESTSQSDSSPTTTSSSTEASDSTGTEQVSSPPPSASASPPPPASASPPPPASSSPPPPASSSPPPPASSSPPPPAPTKSPPPAAATKSPPPPSPSTSPPPPASTPPPATPPPPTKSSPPPPSPTSPPPAPPNSSPPPPSSNPPPATPETSETPPPPASSASPPPTSPPSATPSPPLPEDAPPLQNPPPNAASLPPPPPQAKPASAETPPKAIPSPNPPRSTGSSSSPNRPPVDGGVIAGIVVGGLLIIVLLIVIICLMCKKKRKPQYYMDPNGKNQYYSFAQQDLNISGEFGSMPVAAVAPSTNMGGINHFSYEELAAATNGFSQSNLLGQGGFGLVHKGVLPDKREVAVKSLKSGSGQGEREFQAEVEIISRVHHRHLVSLVGYCIAADKKLLVYEYVPNKTMEFHLHGKDQAVLDWPTRLRIAIGSAKGLAYLHEDCLPRIIHRDIKAANILIDNNYEAMVADFGLAKLTTDNNTHVSTRVMGTFGYLAPEYASSGKLSEKSDVFSFGVMLLELITGKRPIDLTNNMEDSLVEWARPLLSKALEDGNYEELVDPRLQGNYLHHELARMATCTAASIRHSARKRPKMSQIVRALEGDSSMDLNEGVKPGQSGQYNPNGGSDIYDTRAYNADMMKFKKMVMSSQEFNSSEYGTTTTSDTD